MALVGTRMSGLRPVVDDADLAVLRILVDRRRSLGEEDTRKMRRSTTCCSSSSPAAREGPVRRPSQELLATVRPRDAAGKTRRRVAAELIADLADP